MIIGNILKLVRKISHIVFSLVLVMTTAGMTITKHYCGSRLVSVNILSEPEKCCNNSNCCHNETITFKLDSDILNIVPDYSLRIFPSSFSPAPDLFFINNSLFSDILLNHIPAGDITGFPDLPPPKLSTALPMLGAFLL
jgi:hypothetical protein